MKHLTLDDVMEMRPCYTHAQIKAIANGHESMSLLEICDLDIPIADRLWVLLRTECLPSHTLHKLTLTFAERVLDNERAAGREPDRRLWYALVIKRAWLLDIVSNDELMLADYAAMDVMHDAYIMESEATAYELRVAHTIVRAAFVVAEAVSKNAHAEHIARIARAVRNSTTDEPTWQLAKVRAIIESLPD